MRERNYFHLQFCVRNVGKTFSNKSKFNKSFSETNGTNRSLVAAFKDEASRGWFSLTNESVEITLMQLIAPFDKNYLLRRREMYSELASHRTDKRAFRKWMAAFSLAGVFLCASAHAQITLSGKVYDAVTGEALPGVNMIIENTVVGTASKIRGEFTLTTSKKPPFNLIVSSIGYVKKIVEITGTNESMEIRLDQATLMTEDIVVSASRVEESILKSPVSIEKVDILELRETPAASMWDAIKNVREVELIANSLFFKSVRSRGYGGTANVSFKQYVDGVDNAPVANGQFAVGNMAGLSDIDVESIEILPGAASALYGPSAFSGIMFLNSKNPFYHQGLSLQLGSGANSESRPGTTAHYNVAMRYGKAVSDRFAFKIVGDYIKGTDWHAYDFSDKTTAGVTSHIGNPAYNGVNVYGDDYSANLTAVRQTLINQGLMPPQAAAIPLGSETVVTRTGYNEEDLFNYDDAFNLKLSAGIYFRINDNLEWNTKWRYGTGKAIYQGTNRYGLDGLYTNYYVSELKGKNLLLRGFYTEENAGDSYDIVFSGWNVNREWKSDNVWYGQYAAAYVQQLGALLGQKGSLDAEDYQLAHRLARGIADAERLEPGSDAFNETLKTVQLRKDFRTGAGFRSTSGFGNIEGQYDFSSALKAFDLQVGGNFRRYNVNTYGTIYSDGDGNGFNVNEWGAFAQAGKDFLDNNLRLQGSLRADGHTNFDTEFSPRISGVFTVAEDHNFRASYQSAILNPTIEAQYINLNLGPVVLIGGSPDNADRTNKQHFFDGTGAISPTDVGALAAGLITPDQITPISDLSHRSPAKLSEYAFGYKTLLTQNLFVDATYWRQNYSNFFATRIVFDALELQQSLLDPSFSPSAYSVYTNNTEETTLHGFGFSATLDFGGGYQLSGNYTYQDIVKANFDDFVNDTNTPKNKFTASLGHRELFKNFGFKASVRYRDGYFYYSSFDNGDLPSTTIFDAQINYNMPNQGARIKMGVNNLGGSDYLDAIGSVRVGTTFYTTVTFDSLFD